MIVGEELGGGLGTSLIERPGMAVPCCVDKGDDEEEKEKDEEEKEKGDNDVIEMEGVDVERCSVLV